MDANQPELPKTGYDGQAGSEFRPKPAALGMAVFTLIESAVIIAFLAWSNLSNPWSVENAVFTVMFCAGIVTAIYGAAKTYGIRVLVSPESLHFRRLWRSRQVYWTEITRVRVYDRYVLLEASSGSLTISKEIDRFDDLILRILHYTNLKRGSHLEFPIWFYYPIHNDFSFWVFYLTLICFYFLEPFDGRFNIEAGVFLFITSPLAGWICYMKSRRFKFDRDGMTYTTLGGKIYVPAADIRDMWLEHVEDRESGPRNELHFRVPGGEELVLHEGNIGLRDLFETLAPYYLRGEGSRLARSTSILGIF